MARHICFGLAVSGFQWCFVLLGSWLEHIARTTAIQQRFHKLPGSTAWCSKWTSYMRLRCPTLVQTSPVWQHMCNYSATRNSTVCHADARPSRALTMELLRICRPEGDQTIHYKRVSCYLSGDASYIRTSGPLGRSGSQMQSERASLAE